MQRPYKFDFEGKQRDAEVGWNSPEYFFKSWKGALLLKQANPKYAGTAVVQLSQEVLVLW